MEIIIPSVVSIFICLLQPIVNNSSWGRDIERKLELLEYPDKDVEYWVVKDKFHKTKIKFFYSIEEANKYSHKLFVSHVIFDKYGKIVSINGWGFGKNICKTSGSVWLTKYYQDEEQRINFKDSEQILENVKIVFERESPYIEQKYMDLHKNMISVFDDLMSQNKVYYPLKYYKKVAKNLAIVSVYGKCYLDFMNRNNHDISIIQIIVDDFINNR